MLMTDLLMVTSGSNHVITIDIDFLNETEIGFGRQMSLTF